MFYATLKNETLLRLPSSRPWTRKFFQNGPTLKENIFSPQRITCIKDQKWSPTKLTHIVMNNSCVVPLTEIGMEIGDRHYIWGQNGVKGYDLKPFSYQENYIAMVYLCILLLYFFFLKGF